MLQGDFEVSLPAPYLSGAIRAEVYEVEGATPTTIIRTDQKWGVKLHWELVGSLVPLICGEWCIHLFLESMGPADELKLSPNEGADISLDPCGNGQYDFDFQVEPGLVKGEDCSNPYKLVVTISYITSCGKPGPIAGFVEGPLLQFYEA